MARAHRPLTSRPNTRLQPFRFPTIKHQLRQTCLTEESIHELLGFTAQIHRKFAFERKVSEQEHSIANPHNLQDIYCPEVSSRGEIFDKIYRQRHDSANGQQSSYDSDSHSRIDDFRLSLHDVKT